MKRILLTLAICLCGIAMFAQKTFSSENFTTETVDEFGDKTGEIKVGIIAKGYFSNSATTNSCAKFMISFKKKSSWYDLYEYCNNHASKDEFHTTFEGVATGEIVKATYFVPTAFLNLCRENDTIKVKLKDASEYGSTSAVFKLFHCKAFYQSYIKTFGTVEQKKYLLYDSYVNLYNIPLDPYDKFPPLDNPCIGFWKKSRFLNDYINFSGKFKNGDNLSINCNEVKIDGEIVKREDKTFYSVDFNDFMSKFHTGAIIEVFHKDKNISEIFEVSSEEYEMVTNFFNH